MSVDLAEFLTLSESVGKRQLCAIHVVLEQLSKTERAQLEAALQADKRQIKSGGISTWLERRGHKISHNKIASHRAGTCTCCD